MTWFSFTFFLFERNGFPLRLIYIESTFVNINVNTHLNDDYSFFLFKSSVMDWITFNQNGLQHYKFNLALWIVLYILDYFLMDWDELYFGIASFWLLLVMVLWILYLPVSLPFVCVIVYSLTWLLWWCYYVCWSVFTAKNEWS